MQYKPEDNPHAMEAGNKLSYGWITVIAGAIIVCVAGNFQYSFGVFLKPLIHRFGWSRASISLCASIRNIITGIAGPIAGFVQRQRRPVRHVIKGQLVACSGKVDDDGDFALKLRYRFRSPSGQILTGQTSQIRNDLKGAKLPKPGTRIAVYYRSDQSYLLL